MRLTFPISTNPFSLDIKTSLFALLNQISPNLDGVDRLLWQQAYLWCVVLKLRAQRCWPLCQKVGGRNLTAHDFEIQDTALSNYCGSLTLCVWNAYFPSYNIYVIILQTCIFNPNFAYDFPTLRSFHASSDHYRITSWCGTIGPVVAFQNDYSYTVTMPRKPGCGFTIRG